VSVGTLLQRGQSSPVLKLDLNQLQSEQFHYSVNLERAITSQHHLAARNAGSFFLRPLGTFVPRAEVLASGAPEQMNE
jgi:hypothetical protein